MSWLSADIAVDVMPPGGACVARSAAELERVIGLAEVSTSERYRVRDVTGDGRAETFCNIFVSDVTRWLSAEIPHKLDGEWQDVRANAAWLRAGGGGWRSCEPLEAQVRANAGFPAVVVWDPKERARGHIAVVVPQRTHETSLQIAQAGKSNFPHGPLVRGFGVVWPLEFFTHD